MGRAISLLSPLTQMLISSGNILTDTTRIMFNLIQYSAHSGPVKLTHKMLWRQKIQDLLLSCKGGRKVRKKKSGDTSPRFSWKQIVNDGAILLRQERPMGKKSKSYL